MPEDIASQCDPASIYSGMKRLQESTGHGGVIPVASTGSKHQVSSHPSGFRAENL